MKKIFFYLFLTLFFVPLSSHAKCVQGDCINGEGTFEYDDGSKYDGEWKNNIMEGYGTFIWPNGRKYIGEFKDNVLTGKGKYYDPDGKKE